LGDHIGLLNVLFVWPLFLFPSESLIPKARAFVPRFPR